MDRTILHCDCNSFFASVETLLDPSLADGPTAVCGDPESRHGIILAKNEKAKAFGVQTAETIWQAKRKCPDLRLVAPHRSEYVKFSRKCNELYLQYTDLVDPFGIDESFLDVTGSMHLFGSGKHIADELRRRMREEVGLTISVGVSFNRAFAKLGSDYKKPDGTTVFSRENFKQRVWTLPANTLLYVGKRASDRLNRLGVRTIGELAACDPAFIHSILGKNGDLLLRYARGEDDEPVRGTRGQIGRQQHDVRAQSARRGRMPHGHHGAVRQCRQTAEKTRHGVPDRAARHPRPGISQSLTTGNA